MHTNSLNFLSCTTVSDAVTLKIEVLYLKNPITLLKDRNDHEVKLTHFQRSTLFPFHLASTCEINHQA